MSITNDLDKMLVWIDEQEQGNEATNPMQVSFVKYSQDMRALIAHIKTLELQLSTQPPTIVLKPGQSIVINGEKIS